MKNDLQEYLDFLERDKYKDVDKSKSIPEEALGIFTQPSQPEQGYEVPESYVEYSKNPTPLYSSAKKSLSELEADPEFDMRATRFLKGIGRNENIFEYLRDSDYSLSAAAQRSFEVGNWTDEQKQDYLYLREQFDNAELRGLKERLGFVKDFTVDMVADPLNIIAALFAVPTMGASVGAKATATALANQGLKQLTKSQLTKQALKSAKTPAILGAAEGIAWAGPHEYFLQSTDVGLGARDEIDMSLVAGTAALGGLIGGVGVGGLGAINAGRYLSKEFKYSNEEAIIKEGKKKTRKQIQEEEQISSVSEKKDNIISNLIGKPTTAFIQKAKKSATLTDLLDKFRYDWDVSVFGKKDVKVRKDSYGMALGKRQGEYLSGMNRALNPLNKVRRAWYDWSGKLEVKQNDQLAYLLRGGKGKEFNGKPIDNEVFDAYKEIKQLLDNVFNEGNKVGLFSPFQRVTAYMPRKFKYEAIENNYDDFVDLIKKSGHADPLDEIPQVRVITEENQTIVARLEGQNGIDAEAFGFEGNIKSFKELARKELGIDINDTTTRADEVLEKAKELKAERIVTDMLEYRWTPFELRSSLKAGNGSSFIQHRAFKNIDDNALAPYLENDVELVLQDYFTNVSQAIERTRFFGKSVEDFKNNYLKNEAKQTGIYYELINNGVSKADARDTIKKLAVMHGRVTGLDVPSIKSPTLQSLSDWGRLSQQMAHLPFATISSITEPFILLSRVGVEDAPAAVRDIGKALVAETKKTGQRISQGIRRGLGGKTKNLKDLDDEAWSEVYQTGLALEQAVQERIEGLYGEAVKGTVARSLQNTFFKTNLLTQWTSAVQLASFTTGKRLIVRNAERLSKGGLSKEQKEYLTEQLNDLGIDADEAVRFYNKSLDKKGNYSGVLAKQQDFYDTKLLSGANRFTKEIILNPSTAEANRPLWFSTPAAQVLVQFAGYPTVFNNTILKRFASEVSTDARRAIAGVREGRISPLIGQATPKILGTTMLMTGVAMLGNYIRSPEYFDTKFDGTLKSEGEIIMDSIQRWGGFGPFDYAARFSDADEAGAGDLGSLLKAVSGPLPQDAIDSILYRKGIPEIIGTNLPFYSAYDLIFGEGTKKDLRANLRAISKGKPKEETKSTYLPAFSKGGIVKNVSNVTDEPDEMQSRITKRPFNSTAEFVQDEEDRALKAQMESLGLREPYVVGGLAKALSKTIKGKQRSSKRLRKDYLNPDYLETLKPKSAKAASESKFNKSAKDVYDLLMDGQITIKEAETYLKDYGYQNETVKKIVRSFKEVGYGLGDDFISYREPFVFGGLVTRFLTRGNKIVNDFKKGKLSLTEANDEFTILDDLAKEEQQRMFDDWLKGQDLYVFDEISKLDDKAKINIKDKSLADYSYELKLLEEEIEANPMIQKFNRENPEAARIKELLNQKDDIFIDMTLFEAGKSSDKKVGNLSFEELKRNYPDAYAGREGLESLEFLNKGFVLDELKDRRRKKLLTPKITGNLSSITGLQIETPILQHPKLDKVKEKINNVLDKVEKREFADTKNKKLSILENEYGEGGDFSKNSKQRETFLNGHLGYEMDFNFKSFLNYLKTAPQFENEIPLIYTKFSKTEINKLDKLFKEYADLEYDLFYK